WLTIPTIEACCKSHTSLQRSSMKIISVALATVLAQPNHRLVRAFVTASSTTRTTFRMSTVTENPLLQSTSLPKFSSITPSDLTPAISSVLSQLESDFASLESTLKEVKSPDYDAVLPEVERMQHPLSYAWGIAGHLKGVKDSEELRKAYEENQPNVVKATMKFGQSRVLYDALKEVENTWKDSIPQDFEMEQKIRAVSNSLRSMTLAGVGLEEGTEERKRFNEIKLRFAELSTAFSNNVLDATKAFGLTVTSPTDVQGVPESALGMWAQAHKQHLIKEAGDDEVAKADAEKMEVDTLGGPWRITLDGPSYVAAMQHLPNRDLRKQIYLGYMTRASDLSVNECEANEKKEGALGKNNVVIIEEILKLRKELAGLLGFNNYAEMSLASKMAPDVQSVTNLSNLIRDKALPAAEKELAAATALAREVGGDEYSEANLPKLMPWDTSFWVERLKEKTFDLKEEELRPYFALDAVLTGMFGLVERIFDIEVRNADGQAEVWHPDVKFFTIHDKSNDGKHIASFFLDPYSRPADKRGGAWMADCLGKSEALGIDVPVAYLTCNGSPPVGDKPSLMTFREVETLFHEFGHGLQHMLTKATVGDVAGINGVEWDAVELPSQFMENWCYDKPTVYGFAKHYKTGEALPEEMFQKLSQQRTFGAGMMACRQLLFGMMDMELHSNYDPNGSETIFDVHRRMAGIYTPYSMPVEEDRFLCGFSHIFAGGYSAGYYSYKWAEVMSADAFGAFEDVGLENEEGVREVGRRFRDTVLSLGGGVSPMDVFKRFRGREPNPDALLRHNGLA
ncbi:hypothetical protein ACHAW6_012502, partial [Cyclotella cf. meneghiniana]